MQNKRIVRKKGLAINIFTFKFSELEGNTCTASPWKKKRGSGIQKTAQWHKNWWCHCWNGKIHFIAFIASYIVSLRSYRPEAIKIYQDNIWLPVQQIQQALVFYRIEFTEIERKYWTLANIAKPISNCAFLAYSWIILRLLPLQRGSTSAWKKCIFFHRHISPVLISRHMEVWEASRVWSVRRLYLILLRFVEISIHFFKF